MQGKDLIQPCDNHRYIDLPIVASIDTHVFEFETTTHIYVFLIATTIDVHLSLMMAALICTYKFPIVTTIGIYIFLKVTTVDLCDPYSDNHRYVCITYGNNHMLACTCTYLLVHLLPCLS